MLVTTGKVRRGSIEIEGKKLPEGATVTVLVQEGDETFELEPEEESMLLSAIKEAERGEVVTASQLLEQLPRR